jgi:dsRNA-specific ribonuclease
MDNIKNKLLRKKTVEQLVQKYLDIYEQAILHDKIVDKENNDTYIKQTVNIKNIKNIQKAFIHKSFTVTDSDNSDSDTYSCMNIKFFDNYERSETLGDRVIEIATAEFLYFNYPGKNPKFMTEVKSRIVRKESLANLGNKLGFKDFILIGSNIERINGRENTRFLEDIFESFIGMLHIDQNCNKELSKQFLLGVYLEHIDFEDILNTSINHKTTLQHHFHRMKYSHPVYHTLYTSGPTHDRQSIVIVLIPKDKYNMKESCEDAGKDAGIDIGGIGFNIRLTITDDVKNNSSITTTDNICPIAKFEKLIKTGFVVGIGKSNTRQSAEQLCSLNCLANLNVVQNNQ